MHGWCFFNNVPEQLNENVFVCSSYFTTYNFFKYYFQPVASFSKYHALKVTAVPSIWSSEAVAVVALVNFNLLQV